MKAMNAQKHQKLNVTPPMVAQSNAAAAAAAAALSTMNAANYKFLTPAHVGDLNKQGAYMVAPAVLAVTNNS